ncbi:bifunctional enoyl-CoA hydratase/phosphate acetyltransferase [Candidatus Riflebacteria bacterium]
MNILKYTNGGATIFTTFQEIKKAAENNKGKKIVVAVAHNKESIEAADSAYKLGLASGIFVGDARVIENICQEEGVDLSHHQVANFPDEEEAMREAVRLVRQKEGDILMKGSTSTGSFMKALLDKETGLREGGLISHVFVCKPKLYHKLLLITDAGVCIAPDLQQKKMIIDNAVRFAKKLGIENPKVAVLSAIEKVNPQMPTTVEAQKLTEMNRAGEISDCIVQGPLALDLALSKEAARMKKVSGEVPGDADILLVPNIEVGNVFAKSILLLSEADEGGMLVGTTAPVALLSRSDSEETKLNTIRLAVAIS